MKARKGNKLATWQEKAKEGGTCEKCMQIFSRLTVDHIVPVSVLDMLDETGEAKWEWEENFQFLCAVCNGFKANRLDKRNPKTREIIIRLFNINS